MHTASVSTPTLRRDSLNWWDVEPSVTARQCSGSMYGAPISVYVREGAHGASIGTAGDNPPSLPLLYLPSRVRGSEYALSSGPPLREDGRVNPAISVSYSVRRIVPPPMKIRAFGTARASEQLLDRAYHRHGSFVSPSD